MKTVLISLLLSIVGSPVLSQDYVPVADQATFMSLVDGKELHSRLYGVRLNVMDNGRIEGAAVGRGITGNWTWQNGFFCREMAWGERPIPYNCQLVEVRDGNQLRFTVDRGAGDSAAFRLR